MYFEAMWEINTLAVNLIYNKTFCCKMPSSVSSIIDLCNVDVFKNTAVLSDNVKEGELLFRWMLSISIMVLVRFCLAFDFPRTALLGFARQ